MENQTLEALNTPPGFMDVLSRVLEGGHRRFRKKDRVAFRKLLMSSCRGWKRVAGHVCPVLIPGLSCKPVTPATAFASSQKVDFFPPLSGVYQDG